MAKKPPASPKGGGKAYKGTAYTTPSGERRIRIADIRPKPKDDVYEVSLADILLGGATIETADAEQEVRIKPINLKGLAALTRMFGNDLKGMSGLPCDYDQTVKILTILVNQDLPAEQEIGEDTVARMITVDIIQQVDNIVRELISPLFAPGAADT